MNFKNLERLKKENVWVVHKDKKYICRIVNGKPISTGWNNPPHNDYFTCNSFVDNNNFTGVGIVTRFDYGICCLDLDKCRDSVTGNLSEFAKEIINIMQSYTEISPSGTGIHIFFRVDKSIKSRYSTDKYKFENKQYPIGIEAYLDTKYATFTGNSINDFDIEERTEELFKVLDKYLLKNVSSKSKKESLPAGDTGIDKRTVKRDLKDLNLPKKYLYNSDFIKLFLGYTEDHKDKTESETDILLLSYFERYTRRFEDRVSFIAFLFQTTVYFQTKDTKHINKWKTNYAKDTLNLVLANNKILPNKNLLAETKEKTLTKIQDYYNKLIQLRMQFHLCYGLDDTESKENKKVVFEIPISEEDKKEDLDIFNIPISHLRNSVEKLDISDSEKDKYRKKLDMLENCETYHIAHLSLAYELELTWHLDNIDKFSFGNDTIKSPQNELINKVITTTSKTPLAKDAQMVIQQFATFLPPSFTSDIGMVKDKYIVAYINNPDRFKSLTADDIQMALTFLLGKYMDNLNKREQERKNNSEIIDNDYIIEEYKKMAQVQFKKSELIELLGLKNRTESREKIDLMISFLDNVFIDTVKISKSNSDKYKGYEHFAISGIDSSFTDDTITFTFNTKFVKPINDNKDSYIPIPDSVYKVRKKGAFTLYRYLQAHFNSNICNPKTKEKSNVVSINQIIDNTDFLHQKEVKGLTQNQSFKFKKDVYDCIIEALTELQKKNQIEYKIVIPNEIKNKKRLLDDDYKKIKIDFELKNIVILDNGKRKYKSLK